MPPIETFNQALLDWYRAHGRHQLPWRQDITPYRVWVSEIMLQQTQVARVMKEYFPRFLERFPDVHTLADATWDDVYPVWQGLGYYSRGRNMLRTAQILCEKYDGKFPRNVTELQTLPGIGAYTASAILAFAWDEPIAAIDTNLKQVFRAIAPKSSPIETAAKLVKDVAGGREWNSALMDLASALRAGYALEGTITDFFPPEIAQKFRPSRTKTQNPSHPRTSGTMAGSNSRKRKAQSGLKRIEVGVACIHRNGKYLVQTRPADKSFAGKWEFPGGKRESYEDFRACVKREIKEEIGVDVSVRPHFLETVHEFERTVLVLRFHRCQIQAGEPRPREQQQLDWVAPSEFGGREFLPTNTEVLQRLKKMKV